MENWHTILLNILTTIGTMGFGLLLLSSSKYAEKYIAFVFDKSLAASRALQDLKIENLKERLSHITDRAKRSNEREYQAIAASWDAFVEAYVATGQCTTFLITHPDLSSLSDDDGTAVRFGDGYW